MPAIVIDPEFQALIPPLRMDELTGLEASLLAEGCRDPLCVMVVIADTWYCHECNKDVELKEGDGIVICVECDGGLAEWEDTRSLLLLDGHNRYALCTQHDIPYETREIEVRDRAEAKVWILQNQLGRRNLSDYDRGVVALQLQPLLAEQAKARQREHGGTAPGRTHVQNSAHVFDIHPRLSPVREEAATLAGLSHDTLTKIADIQNTGTPALITTVREGGTSIHAAAALATLPALEQEEIVARGPKEILAMSKEIRAMQQEERRCARMQAIMAQTQDPPDLLSLGRFAVLYADPPWQYDYAETESRAIENHYPTMTLEEIGQLPIADVSYEDCVLFLWATSPKLLEALDVMHHWGFTYKTCAIWDKERMGMGYYFRQQHELLLVGTKGAMPAPAPETRPSSVFRIPREANHSTKPEEIYAVIDTMYPGVRKLELFARTAHDGWQAWGNQLWHS